MGLSRIRKKSGGSVETVIDNCISQIAPEKPGAIGISNQRESILAWDRSSGRPPYFGNAAEAADKSQRLD
jgi:glycerol kinase